MTLTGPQLARQQSLRRVFLDQLQEAAFPSICHLFLPMSRRSWKVWGHPRHRVHNLQVIRTTQVTEVLVVAQVRVKAAAPVRAPLTLSRVLRINHPRHQRHPLKVDLAHMILARSQAAALQEVAVARTVKRTRIIHSREREQTTKHHKGRVSERDKALVMRHHKVHPKTNNMSNSVDQHSGEVLSGRG